MSPIRDTLLPFARPHRGMLGRGLGFSCVLVGARLALPLPLTAAVGLPCLRLVRWRVGPWSVEGLGPGEWREIAAPQLGRISGK